MDAHLANMKNQKKSTGKIICKVVTATINRALSCERSGALAPGIVNKRRAKTMMYSEFIELSGKTESYISYVEYSTFIEPIYMDSNYNSKAEFIGLLNDTFKKIVYPVVEQAIRNLSMNDKLSLWDCNSSSILNQIEKVDFEARKIAYEYMKLYSKL